MEKKKLNGRKSGKAGEASTVQGFRTPASYCLTENEMGWIEMLRIISNDSDPRITLQIVQFLRQVLAKKA